MDSFIKNIVKEKIPCYFISPHLDDAFLSAGDLISYLSKYTNVTIITIFTEASSKPYTMAANAFLRYCGVKDADELFKIRKEEDKRVCKKAKVNSIYLGFTDGSWRKKGNPNLFVRLMSKKVPEVMHLYPLGRTIIKLANEDLLLKEKIKERIKEIIGDNKKRAVFSPLGTVKHMDHTITRNASMEAFDDVIFWTDFPYIKKNNYKNKFTERQNLKRIAWSHNRAKKKKLIIEYKTQLSSLFPNGRIRLLPEIYYYKS